jgi:hypothetical protein
MSTWPSLRWHALPKTMAAIGTERSTSASASTVGRGVEQTKTEHLSNDADDPQQTMDTRSILDRPRFALHGIAGKTVA